MANDLSDVALDRMHSALTDLLDAQHKLNDAFPETQKFLATRGLTSVAQLDADGRKALERHLLDVLGNLLKRTN